MFKKLNLNPKNKKTTDCVVRAFSLATGKSWEQTLTDLFNIALEIKTIPNDKETYSIYAEDLGFKKHKSEVINGHRPTVESFTKNNPDGVYVLKCANHLVAVKDGDYYDTGDVGNKSVYTWWEVITKTVRISDLGNKALKGA